jgi:hypothetical protein
MLFAIMIYTPEYVPGEIVVCFKSDFNNHYFASSFGEGLGYEFLGDYVTSDMYAYKVPVGSELEAIKRFRKYKELVDWTDRLDAKFEQRSNDLDSLVLMVQNLDDAIEASDKRYNKELDKIIKYIESLKYNIPNVNKDKK